MSPLCGFACKAQSRISPKANQSRYSESVFTPEYLDKHRIYAGKKVKCRKKAIAIAFKNGVEFLGRRFFIDGKGKIIQKLTKSSKQRIMKKVKKKVFIAEILDKTRKV